MTNPLTTVAVATTEPSGASRSKDVVIAESSPGSCRVKVSPACAELGTAQVRFSVIGVVGPAEGCLMLTLVIALSIVAAEARVSCEAPTTHASPSMRTAPMMATRRGKTLAVDNTMDPLVRFESLVALNSA